VQVVANRHLPVGRVGELVQVLHQLAAHHRAVGDLGNLAHMLRFGDAEADGDWQCGVLAYPLNQLRQVGRELVACARDARA
jgi:hypothetical protein